jgi:hypothetical protein
MKNFTNQTKFIATLIMIAVTATISNAQSNGDYRTAQAGDWNNTSTWEIYDGSTWGSTTFVPVSDQGAGTVTLYHNVTVGSTSSSLSSTVITSGNTLTVQSTGTFSLGTGTITGAGNFTVSGGGTLEIGSADGIDASLTDGNIQISGTMSLSTSGNYVYNGTGDQITGTGIPSTVAELEIINGNKLTLSKQVSVDSSLNLVSGNLYSDSTNYIRLNSGAVFAGPLGGSTKADFTEFSYIVGPTQIEFRNSNNVIHFMPLGIDTAYHPIRIEMNHASASQNLYWFGVVNPSANNQAVDSNKGIKSIHPAFSYYQGYEIKNSALNQQKITIYWFDNDGVRDLSSTTVAQWKNNIWSEVTGGYTTTGDTTEGAITFSNNSQDRRDFALATSDYFNNPVPVTLIDFNANVVGEQVALNWTTAQEINNSHFVIERSIDNVNFEFLTEVQGAGNTAESRDYMTIDFNPPAAGTVFYRLTQVDFDGTEEVIGLEAVNLSSKSNIVFSPNPANGRVEVTIPEGMVEGTVQITDLSGKVLIEKSLDANNIVTVDVAALRPGTYFINVGNESEVHTSRIIKN